MCLVYAGLILQVIRILEVSLDRRVAVTVVRLSPVTNPRQKCHRLDVERIHLVERNHEKSY